MFLWLHRRFGGDLSKRPLLIWSGYLPLLGMLIWANFEYWPDFLPSRVYPGFPHGMELFIAPLFFAPIAMAVCIFAAWLLGRSQA